MVQIDFLAAIHARMVGFCGQIETGSRLALDLRSVKPASEVLH